MLTSTSPVPGSVAVVNWPLSCAENGGEGTVACAATERPAVTRVVAGATRDRGVPARAAQPCRSGPARYQRNVPSATSTRAAPAAPLAAGATVAPRSRTNTPAPTATTDAAASAC